jgi:sodium/pantothenate symporter
MTATLPGLTLFAEDSSAAVLVTFLIYMVGVFALAIVSNRLLQGKNFVSEYFLGSRSLGVWAFALTFAATSSSGGSFMGFPSKIYTHGWVLALWIGSYMVVPICTMGLLGKRMNQVARISGSITVPDVIRDRFHSAKFGLLAIVLIVFFMSFNLVAQFKAGAMILKTLLGDMDFFQTSVAAFRGATDGLPWLRSPEGPSYVLGLLVFGLTVIIYTSYGGFHAVVWTDVMQGIIMVIGVIIMLPLALFEVGGLERATRQLARQTPPYKGTAALVVVKPDKVQYVLPAGTWFSPPATGDAQPRLFRTTKGIAIPADKSRVPDVPILEITTPKAVNGLLNGDDELDPVTLESRLRLEGVDVKPYKSGADQPGVYVTGPGPDPKSENGFLPLSLAVSFFFMWAISGAGQPSNMVRLMAFNSSRTLKRSIFTVAIYYTLIYFPLVMIFTCARILMPGMEGESDRIMPAMAVYLTDNAGVGWLAGLLIAAPFAAVMSTVDSFLLMISSALVRDIYQRNINPEAEEKIIKRLSFTFTLLVGLVAMFGALNPPQFLQDIIVYVGSGLAACFLAPMVFALYWPRSNVQGCTAGMLAGFGAHLAMYVTGYYVNESFFRPYQLLNFDPIIIGLFVSFVVTYVATIVTPPPPEELVRKYFCKRTA